jgi:hypothetical protein
MLHTQIATYAQWQWHCHCGKKIGGRLVGKIFVYIIDTNALYSILDRSSSGPCDEHLYTPTAKPRSLHLCQVFIIVIGKNLATKRS